MAGEKRPRYYQKEDFDRIYKEKYPVLVKYIYFHIQDAVEAQDIAQDIFLSFFRKMTTMEYRMSDIQLWLYLCAYRKINSYLREKYKNRWYSSDVSLESIAEENVSRFHLTEVAPILTRDEMHYIYLCFYCGFKNREIKTIMGYSVTTLKRIKKEALKKIKNYLHSI